MSDPLPIFEDALMFYFAKDDWAARGAQPAGSIFDQISKGGRASFFFESVEIPNSKEELKDVLDQLVEEGLLGKRYGSSDSPMYFVTDQGVYEAAGFEVIAAETGEPILTENGEFIELESRVTPASRLASQKSSSVDTEDWTGPQFVLTDAKVIRQIRIQANELRTLVHSIHFESNSDSHDLKALADALVAVCSMAEPELSIIERILAHPKFKCTAALVAAVATIRGALGI